MGGADAALLLYREHLCLCPPCAGGDLTGVSGLPRQDAGICSVSVSGPVLLCMMHMALAFKDHDQVLPGGECGVQEGSGSPLSCGHQLDGCICLQKIEFYSEPFTFYGAFKIQGSKKKKKKSTE